jgi:hypothetical protein
MACKEKENSLYDGDTQRVALPCERPVHPNCITIILPMLRIKR